MKLRVAVEPTPALFIIGAIVFIGRELLIPRQKGGNSFVEAKILQEVLKLEDNLFVHGHGEIIDRSGVERAIQELEAKQAHIKALLVDQGKSLEEIKTALNVQETPPLPGWTRRPSLGEIIYSE